MRASRGLKWENKMYKLKRSIKICSRNNSSTRDNNRSCSFNRNNENRSLEALQDYLDKWEEAS